jgi:phosphoribosylformylglycinamidine cyclo-ligase
MVYAVAGRNWGGSGVTVAGLQDTCIPAYPVSCNLYLVSRTCIYPTKLLTINYLCRLYNQTMSLYSKRGVSAQKEDVHEAIKNLDKGLYPNAFCKILPDVLAGDDRFCSIMHADTAGTKSILAYLYWRETGDLSVWKGIAQDAIVMNTDDMICAGATGRMVLSSTIARNKHLIPGEVLSAVINGCEELLQQWREYGIDIAMAGGETADVGDLVRTIDVGYTAFARFEKSKVVTINPQPGDVVVGFASFGQAAYEDAYNSGIGCNGLTSARHDILHKTYAARYPESFDHQLDETVCYIGSHQLTDATDTPLNIGQLLLSPTRTYAPLIKVVLDQHFEQVHGIVHCTGGGQTKCMKYLGDGIRVVKDNLFEPPLIFKLIQQSSGADAREMYQVFNMGQRLEIFTNEAAAASMIAIAGDMGIEARITGRVEAAEKTGVLLKGGFGDIEY